MTVFTKIEATVNNRPLTYVRENPENLEPLTLNYLLAGRYNGGAVIQENDRDISSRGRFFFFFFYNNDLHKKVR